MEQTCLGKGIVIRMSLTFGSFGGKTRVSCVYNETAGKQRNFSSFTAQDVTLSINQVFIISWIYKLVVM